MNISTFKKKAAPLADQEARNRIRDDLATTLVVEAAAGTGKTSALIGRILAGIVSGRVRLANIVAVTFTEFAAGELKLRLRSAIEEARQQYAVSAESGGESQITTGQQHDRAAGTSGVPTHLLPRGGTDLTAAAIEDAGQQLDLLAELGEQQTHPLPRGTDLTATDHLLPRVDLTATDHPVSRGDTDLTAPQTASAKQITDYLTQAVRELEEARIGTIHSFCADLLREHPVEAQIDPLFEVAPDDMTYPLFDLAFERWFEKQLENPGEAVRRILRIPQRKGFSSRRSATLARRPRESGPKPILRNAAWELIKERDFTAPWKRCEGFDRDSEIDELMDEIMNLGNWSEKGQADQWLTKSLGYLKRFAAEATRLESLGEPRDYDGIEARLFGLLGGWKGKDWRAYWPNDDFPADDLRNRRDELKARVKEFVDKAGADLAPRLREELWQVVEDFEQLKERAGYLDFLDLLLRARNLVRDNRDIRVELQQRFTHIFVDEFQDTDPLQAEILMLLGSDDPDQQNWRQVRPVPGKLFIVGDPKQSIYRFRRADVALYQAVKRQVIASGGALVDLNVSFRAVPEIQQAVNAAFAPVMAEESLTQAHYVPLAPSRTGSATQPAIIALPVSQPYGDFGKVVDWKIEKSLPGDVAAFVNWLINESGWTVTERGRSEGRVPLQARHICLLFRRFRQFFTDVSRPYVQALEEYRIPHLLVGGSSFHSREEVEAIRNALTAIEWPDDELAVFATLHGPLFAFTDAQLLSYRNICRTLHPFKQPPDDLPESLTEVVAALGLLRELHRKRNRRPIAETIQRLLALTRAHAGFANWSTGEQALANIMRLTDMARRAERNGLISFRAFVDWLDEEAESGDAGDAPIMEEGVDGVRIMTVHKAKGLEFPVVLLADITAKDTREPSKWVDLTAGLSATKLAGCTPIEIQEHAEDEMRIEQEEAARILYVAATRARDLLVVSAVGDHPYEGWLGTLNPVLYPPEDTSFNPETRQAPGCPVFGEDAMLARPQKAIRRRGSVSPGLHRPQVGEHRVVWWDPAVLAAPVSQARSSTRLTEYLKEDDGKVRSQEGIRAHDQWQAERANTRTIAGRPEWTVLTATAYASTLGVRDPGEVEALKIEQSKLPQLPEVAVEKIEIDFSRPHGKRFGTLVHAVLSVVVLNSDRDGIEAVARVQGRVLGATEEEVAVVVEIVQRALEHPLLKRAAAAVSSGNCRREVPVVMQLEDGVMIEGVVDLAFREDGADTPWTVVDYKTDFEMSGRLEEYRRQVGLYALAISRATGKDARGTLLRI